MSSTSIQFVWPNLWTELNQFTVNKMVELLKHLSRRRITTRVPWTDGKSPGCRVVAVCSIAIVVVYSLLFSPFPTILRKCIASFVKAVVLTYTFIYCTTNFNANASHNDVTSHNDLMPACSPAYLCIWLRNLLCIGLIIRSWKEG